MLKLISLLIGFIAAVSGTPLFGILANPFAPKFSTIQPSNPEITTAAACAPTSNYKDIEYVCGNVFDRIYIIFLENADYMKAVEDCHLKKLQKKGITLCNYWALTHTSEPNYIAAVGGDYYGLDTDDFVRLPERVFSIVDLLEYRNISWAEYQEHMPFTGYQGFEYKNQCNGANDYVRKHNPLIMYDSVTNNARRLSNIKNFTELYSDVANRALPQWAFITCNMSNGGHDTTVAKAGEWAYNFLDQLLVDEYCFHKTLLVLTFDEVDRNPKNRVLALLLGDIPCDLQNTVDETYYDHYSLLSSVEANWDLPNLGRGDCGANTFEVIARTTGYKNKQVDTRFKFNALSPPGWLAESFISIPPPDLNGQGAGGPILPEIARVWQ
ncbi:hypothetical protein AWJ20_2268 [Sugiyamaella lignohabitans]|uniref:Acid phosphatase n=1 Tax=Sugiyamaella lignohabitans TaxID=796027 RepID=A0A167F095_9ASCO|nr:uncharacterized protein AWJ20_2268 [Sugiyamaella lignohabitans]ANB14663.1 hypothetical protein AWJ20_2268 [Sugiyamaella lignohabitans]